MEDQKLIFRIINPEIINKSPEYNIEGIIIDEKDLQIGEPLPLQNILEVAKLKIFNYPWPGSTMHTFYRGFVEIYTEESKYFSRKYYIWKQDKSDYTFDIYQMPSRNYMDIFLKTPYIENSFKKSR